MQSIVLLWFPSTMAKGNNPRKEHKFHALVCTLSPFLTYSIAVDIALTRSLTRIYKGISFIENWTILIILITFCIRESLREKTAIPCTSTANLRALLHVNQPTQSVE